MIGVDDPMRLFLAIALLLGLTGTAMAGPWPRAQGETYVYFGHAGPTENWTSLYAEHGGPRNLTFGLELGGHVLDRAMARPGAEADGRFRLFVRAPVLAGLGDVAGPWLFAAELGAGSDLETTGDLTPRLSLGLSAGRPVATGLGDGWTSFSLQASFAADGAPRYHLQAAVGLKPLPRLSVDIGLFAEFEGEASVTLSPGIEYDLGRIGTARLGVAIKDDGASYLQVGWSHKF